MRRIALLTCLATLVPAGTALASFAQDNGSPLPTNSAVYDVAAADFDGNGRPDLVGANGDDGSGTVSLFMQSAGGTWSSGITLTEPAPGADTVATADFNGDGRQDIAVGSYAFSDGGVVLLRKADNTGFVQDGATFAIDSVTSVAAGDLNGDHKTDLAFSGGSKLWFVLRNSSNTGFDAPIALSSPSSTGTKQGLAIGDFSGDGRPDLVASNLDTAKVDLWVQSTSGAVSFTLAGPFAVDANAYGIIARDFNGDGQLDVATAMHSIDKVEVLLGHSNKTLTKEASYAAGDGPIGLEAGDFNSDGKSDLAVANQAGARVTVMLRTATGFTKDPSSPIVTNLAATGITVADFNKDTRPDIAAANIGASFLTVLLNTTPFPPPPPPPPPPDLDLDDDGVQTPLDCDDHNPLIKPGAVDIPGDGINQDCSADGDADFPLPGTKLRYSVLTYPAGGYSQFGKLTVAPVKKGDRITLQCKGRGCKFKKKVVKVSKNKASLSLLKVMKKAQLRKGAVVTMRMTRAMTYGTYARWTIRAPKASRFSSKCLRPGKKKPVKCPSS